MAIERDYATERLAGIDALLTDAKAITAAMISTDKGSTRQLAAKLDDMLKELRWTDHPDASPQTQRSQTPRPTVTAAAPPTASQVRSHRTRLICR
jgi:hypothetical protein